MKKNTQCVHSGSYHDLATGGVNTPVFTSSAYAYLDRDQQPYPRYFNTPNQNAVVEKLCQLEGGEDGVLFSSGMAAISTVFFAFLKAGSHVVLQAELYGGTYSFVTSQLEKRGIEYSLVATDADAIISAIQSHTHLIYMESPTNPLLSVLDIRKVAAAARERNILCAIDNTFASPINQTPLELGVDLTIHSGTKYLGGHSDLSCGVAIGSVTQIKTVRNTALALGGNLNAQDCYLLERSLKTLNLRVQQQNANAMALATYLQSHQQVRHVYYPGLETHAGYAVARKQMHGFGGMLSFELSSDAPSAYDFQSQLKLIAPALSLGGVDSTICAPAVTSHRHMTAAQRQEIGVSDGLLRLSVGIEDFEDLIADIEQALL